MSVEREDGKDAGRLGIDDVLGLAKRRGLFWQSAGIYGAAAGLYDYGDVGTLLKRRFEHLWLSYFVDTNQSYHLIEGTTLLPEKPLIASGHASRFNDIIVGCAKCHTFYRADVLLNESGAEVSEGATSEQIDAVIIGHGIRCPKDKGQLMPSKPFNMMLDVQLGPERSDKGYLRPETAQSAYLNFFREFNVLRKSLPLGLAIIGRAYRNEISPRQGLYRMRELTQAELQIFFDPESWKPNISHVSSRKINVVLHKYKEPRNFSVAELVGEGVPEFYAYHMAMIDTFYRDVIGVPQERFRFLEKGPEERAFYNRLHMDIEVDIGSWGGFKEVGGLHYRGDYDLSSHSKGSNQDHSVSSGGRKIMPHVLELSFGVDRNIWMLIDVFYQRDGERTVLKVAPFLAPYELAVLPLQSDEAIDKAVADIYRRVRPWLKVYLDTGGSIGRRYARMDEIGTPFCATVDYETVDSKSANFGTVTVRHRDDKKQERVKVEELDSFVAKRTMLDPYKHFHFD